MTQAATLRDACTCIYQTIPRSASPLFAAKCAPFRVLWLMSSVESARIRPHASGRVPVSELLDIARASSGREAHSAGNDPASGWTV